MIYRDKRTIYFPIEDGTFQAETLKSINGAKRVVRERKLTVRRGKPPAKTAAQKAAELFDKENKLTTLVKESLDATADR